MKITNETTVTIHYTLSEKGGEILEKTEPDDPVTYLQGLEMMLPAVEKALEGRISGDKVTLDLSVDEAFGDRIEELVIKVPIAEFEDPKTLEAGSELIVGDGEEESLMVIVAIAEDEVTLDGNHPYAGKEITFNIEVIDVHKTTDEDLEQFSHDHDEDCDCGNH
ncbi:MAG: FKBP-type peptidyl-prolyl cis-trans isomerase [Spirochaetales bacterium]|nr:FKBP-type peptidyl-prolyl cis-trans isomerase [Spirochaetales bacterium]